MMQFIIVMMIIGTVTSYIFDTDTAFQVGLKVMNWWILAGLAIVFLAPIFNIMSFVIAVVSKIARFARRKREHASSQLLADAARV